MRFSMNRVTQSFTYKIKKYTRPGFANEADKDGRIHEGE